QLPAAGGGEPSAAELAAPVGDYPSSLHLVRDTIIAVGPRLIVCLGNIAVRVSVGAARLEEHTRLPSLAQATKAGLERNTWHDWPEDVPPDSAFKQAWERAWHQSLPSILWLTHPSGQNMSPFAGTDTLFHTRMLDARAALQGAARAVLGWQLPDAREAPPHDG